MPQVMSTWSKPYSSFPVYKAGVLMLLVLGPLGQLYETIAHKLVLAQCFPN